MAEITAKLVKELREKSGAGVMDAKKALVEVEGDIEKAIELLREKGMAKAAKKADRVAAEGLTGVYVNGNVAAVVEVNAETDFVAKNAQFVELVNATAKVIAEGKPEKIWDKIIPGKMDRFFLDNTKVDQAYTLLAQVYIMDDSKTVEAYLESVNASVIEFVRFEVGEGIEKASNDFEAEVAATMAAALNN